MYDNIQYNVQYETHISIYSNWLSIKVAHNAVTSQVWPFDSAPLNERVSFSFFRNENNFSKMKETKKIQKQQVFDNWEELFLVGPFVTNT